MRVIVIGAGLFGTATAFFLASRGVETVVLDRRAGVAEETSYANSGILHAGNAAPWNKPHLPRQMLTRPGSLHPALGFHPKALLGMGRWGWQTLANCRRARFQHSLRVNARLAAYSLSVLRELRASEGLRYRDVTQGSLVLFSDEGAFQRGRAEASLLAEEGVDCRVLDSGQVAAREPALASCKAELTGGIYYPGDESGDAHVFTEELARRAEQQGAEFRLDTPVRGLLENLGEVNGVTTAQGTFTGDAYVLAAGSASPFMARPLGLRLPLYPVKGYSLTLPTPEGLEVPAVPLIDSQRAITFTQLGDRFRVGGLVDLEGFNTEPHPHRLQALWNTLATVLPQVSEGLDLDEGETWAGLRPMTPDGRPILGECPVRRLYLATGGGHLGWTMAAGAGRLTADRITGEAPEMDVDDLAYQRFRG